MTIKEIYQALDTIGVLTFSTIENMEVHSRVAHLNGFDHDGIYFRTMSNKPFARQLKANNKLTICGISDSRILGHDGEGVPDFPPGYFIRMICEVVYMDEAEVRQRAQDNPSLQLAVHDLEKYPMMAQGNFRIVKARGEVFDYDFNCQHRDHKILRERFDFGGMTSNKPGPRITDACIACGQCYEVCSFKAIKKGSVFEVISEKCDDCGSCMHICPVDAIELSHAL